MTETHRDIAVPTPVLPRPFRFAVLPITDPSRGGMYQYSLTMMRRLSAVRADRLDEFIAVLNPDAPQDILELQDWDVRRLATTGRPVAPVLRRLARRMPRQIVDPARHLLRAVHRRTSGVSQAGAPSDFYRQLEVDLAIHPAPTLSSAEAGIPYIMAVHDLQHRLQPEFPEVSANGEWEARERLFITSIRQATLILTDSEVGREDVLTLYPDLIDEDRVCVLPFLPPPYVGDRSSEADRQRVRTAHNLPDRYVFYPAQFWPHKNHARIVEAVGMLRDEGVQVSVVFSGTHSADAIRQDTFAQLQERVHSLGISDQVRFLDYVPNGDMPAIYAEATALVMPTFFGPTNIPVLEAWSLGCPVITSDIRGIREQAGDAALLVDPRSSEAIAAAIRQVWESDELRLRLAERGRARLAAFTEDDYDFRLNEILDRAKVAVQAGTRPQPAARG